MVSILGQVSIYGTVSKVGFRVCSLGILTTGGRRRKFSGGSGVETAWERFERDRPSFTHKTIYNKAFEDADT